MTEFEAFCRSLGLQPGAIVADGKWRRCPTDAKPRSKRGAYRLAVDGRTGWAWDPGIHPKSLQWWPDKPDVAPSFDPRKLDLARREQRQRFAEAARAAQAYYERCRPLQGAHPYLERKGLGVDGCEGVRVDPDGKLWTRWLNHVRAKDGERALPLEPPLDGGWLVVPAYRKGTLVSVQRIAPDGGKLFWRGGMMGGASYLIDRPQASITVVAEGLATALAIFAAAPLTRVVCAFNAGNMPRIDMPFHGLMVIAADNDHRTICQQHKAEGWDVPYAPWEDRPDWCRCNPGRIAAAEAAEAFGAGVAVPEGIDGTDWADWFLEHFNERRERWTRRPHETDATLRRAVGAELASHIARHAKFVAPKNGRKQA